MNNTSSEQITPVNKKLIGITILAIALCVISCITYKATHASMTHDESSTYLNLVEGSTLNLWSCYSNPECWTTANNHLLNTLLMRWCAGLFGPTAFALRLPNLLLLCLYLFCVILLIRDTAHNGGEALIGTALLTFNPFVLDFFALARGYGMGVGFMMLSMFAMWRYFLTHRAGYCALSFGAASIAVFANLTYVAYVVALTGAVLLSVIVTMIRRPRRPISGIIPLSVAVCLIFLSVYFYRPILILIGLGEFEYGAPSLWESWKGFARDSLYGLQWFGEKTTDIMAIATAVIMGLSVSAVWLPSESEDKQAYVTFGRFLSLLCIILVVFFVISHVWTGSFYPSGRKSIIFFPCAALLVYMMIHRFIRSKRIWIQVPLAVAGLILLVHFGCAFNSRTFREWWYDASTKEMSGYISDKASGSERISLGVEWIFHPSTQFYVQTNRLPIDLAPYSKEISASDPVQYYYVHPEHVPKLESDFVVEKNFDGRLLLKRGRMDEGLPAGRQGQNGRKNE